MGFWTPHGPVQGADASALGAEVSLLDAARVASARGDHAEAIGLVARYHHDFDPACGDIFSDG